MILKSCTSGNVLLAPAHCFARQFSDRQYEFQHVGKAEHLKGDYSPQVLWKVPLCVLVFCWQKGYLWGYSGKQSIRSPRHTTVIVVNPRWELLWNCPHKSNIIPDYYGRGFFGGRWGCDSWEMGITSRCERSGSECGNCPFFPINYCIKCMALSALEPTHWYFAWMR